MMRRKGIQVEANRKGGQHQLYYEALDSILKCPGAERGPYVSGLENYFAFERLILYACRKRKWKLFPEIWFGFLGLSINRLVIYYLQWGFGWSSSDVGQKMVEKVEECIGEYMMACTFKIVEDAFMWAFANI